MKLPDRYHWIIVATFRRRMVRGSSIFRNLRKLGYMLDTTLKATFHEWLVSQGYNPKTISSRISNAARVEEYHGDLDQHFVDDRLEGLISSLRYSTDDQQNGRQNPSGIPIDGDIRTNLATSKPQCAVQEVPFGDEPVPPNRRAVGAGVCG